MPLQLDHVVIAVDDLDKAIQDYRSLGFTVIPGGVHANHATHNALIAFSDGTYIELLAATGDAPLPDMIDFSRMLKDGEGLAGFALSTQDIEAEARRLQQEGFAVGDVTEGSRIKDGRTMEWKLALIEDGFAPFLIQDTTPREWRVPGDPAAITHQNRAVGIPAVEYAVRDMDVAISYFTRLLALPVPDSPGSYHEMGCIVLNSLLLYHFRYAPDELPEYLKHFFRGRVSQDEIDQADPDKEPKSFAWIINMREYWPEFLRKNAEREEAADAALGSSDFAPFSIHLIREEANRDAFTPDRAHGVRFHHKLGVPAQQGMDILKGLDEIDWSATRHAHGPATDVPDLIRALTSNNADVRDYAYEELAENIADQGTIYEASVEVIPFLVQMIDASGIDHAAHLGLLSILTYGGMATPRLKEATSRRLEEALPTFIKNLSHPGLSVRLAIVKNLQLCPSELDALEPLLKERIETDPVPEVQAACLLTLVGLWTEMQTVELSPEQAAYVSGILRNTTYPPALRFRAALILVKHHTDEWLDEAMSLITHLMENDFETLEATSHYHWVGGVFYSVVDALKDNPELKLQWIITQAQHTVPKVRIQAAYALSHLMRNGVSIAQILPTIEHLLDDPVPDVREGALRGFSHTDHVREAADKLSDLAENDPSLTIRTTARRILRSIS